MMKHPLQPPTLVVLLARCMVIAVIASSVPYLPAQTQSNRLVHVTITDPLGRFVTSIEQERFEIVENGIQRPITGFSDVDSPILLAIVSEKTVTMGDLNPRDVLIQTPSLNDAIQQLSASKNLRKALVVTAAIDAQAIPSGIQIVQAKPDDLFRVVVELRNEYLLQFESSNSSSAIEVVLKQPRGLPSLQATLK
jgi:hypothetical protein